MSKSNKDWSPKLSIPIREDQYRELQGLIQWGLKGRIYQHITDDLIRILKSPLKEKFLGAILADDRHVHLEDFSSAIKEDKE